MSTRDRLIAPTLRPPLPPAATERAAAPALPTLPAAAPLDDEALRRLASASHGEPFSVLGPQPDGNGLRVRAYLPGALAVSLLGNDNEVLGELTRGGDGNLFEGRLRGARAYRLRIAWPGATQDTADPYAYPPLLGELDLHLFTEGRHWQLGRVFGAQPITLDGVAGTRFAVWAPNARAVSVIGDFNSWDARRHPLRLRETSGVWELFVPQVGTGAAYKYHLLGADGSTAQKADPIARMTEAPPATASRVASGDDFAWTDAAWLKSRGARQAPDAPMSIYEVHVGSWWRDAEHGNRSLDWRGLADKLAPYAQAMGFTHLELLPIMEFPFGGSWGYQPLSLYAPSARYGTPEDFAYFVDRCHALNLGVILDWVPAHFPTDAHGLVRFDGTHLYEHANPFEGFHQDWNTLIYNLGRNEVRGHLIASALEWLERFHVDGLRVDAVASMLYRDYSRKAGEWIPNRYGGRENFEAIEFLKTLNTVVRERHSDCVMIAEESTAWPGVTRAVADGGLGFHYKWNMGWMHDTLDYVAQDPLYRSYAHDRITFGLVYAYSEKFVLPISHDEVVHGKRSLLGKMPGDAWQQFANLRAYLAFMWAHPGKKLLFMGCELAQVLEWNHDAMLAWSLLDDPCHRGVQKLLRDLNHFYRDCPALHARDSEAEGFEWLIIDDRANSVFAFLRRGAAGAAPVLVVVNMTPVPHAGYRIGVPQLGRWQELLNTDAASYAGSNAGNGGGADADSIPAHGQPASVSLTLPPLATLYLQAAITSETTA